MRKLVWCELYKLKRNKSILLLTSLALLFPAALTLFTKSGLADAANPAEFHAYYDSLFNNNLVYSAMLLLPCLFGCLGAILFFSERDCDTFKNLQVIPVTRNQLIFAKLMVMYLWSELYSLCSVLAVTFFCFVLEPLAVYDVLFKVLSFMQPHRGDHHGNGIFAGCGTCDLQQSKLSFVAFAFLFVCRRQLASSDLVCLPGKCRSLAAADERAYVRVPSMGVEKRGPWPGRNGTVTFRHLSAGGSVSSACFCHLHPFANTIL